MPTRRMSACSVSRTGNQHTADNAQNIVIVDMITIKANMSSTFIQSCGKAGQVRQAPMCRKAHHFISRFPALLDVGWHA